MDLIIKNYGKFFLEAIAVILLISLLMMRITDENGNVGMFRILGANMETKTPEYHSYTDFGTYEAECNRTLPSIVYQGSNSIHIGINKIFDYVKAKDYEGKEIAIRVLEAKDPTGIEIPVAEDSTVDFQKAGIYTIKVRAVDAFNRKTDNIIRIPVNE